MPVVNASFVVERRYRAPPPRVFAAWADTEAKAAWFNGPGGRGRADYRLDFRVGGREENSGETGTGHRYRYSALYYDVLADERIIYAYDMAIDEVRISSSLATLVLLPDGTGTRMIFTEQGAYLDGSDTPAQREHGTRALLDALAAQFERPISV